MKTIKQLREEYDNTVLDQVQNAPDELMLEGRERSVISPSPNAAPSPSDMPSTLLFRRIAYRQYPNKQVVALYYSKLVNKYLSIPFGPDGNLNLSEAVVHDELDEGYKAVLKGIGGGISGGLQGAAKGAFKGAAVAADPGFVVGGVVGGVKGAYKGAKKAYGKAKEQENMEEDWSDAKYKNPEGGLTKAGVMKYRSEHPGSKLQTAVTTKPSKLKKGSKAANRRKSFCARMGGMKKRLTSAKTARDPDSRINKALRKWNCEESFRVKLAEKRQERIDEWGPVVSALLSAGGSILKNFMGNDKDAAERKDPAMTKSDIKAKAAKPPSGRSSRQGLHDKTKSSFNSKYDASVAKDIGASQQKQPQKVAENKISDIQKMITEGNETMDLHINGRSITLNNSMAKKIIRVYESVNIKNKKIVESMLNEDLDSFKKLLNFSIKA
jgi:hypothetical protein